MLFAIIASLIVSLSVASTRAADLDVPTDEKILRALKANAAHAMSSNARTIAI
jgi:hypothetical protein